MVTQRNQLKVAPLKNLFFLAFLKLDVKDSFGYNKEIERMGKTFPKTNLGQFLIWKTLPSMYFIDINIM